MDAAVILQTIAEPTRCKIVQLLSQKHHCSRSLSRTLGISEPAVSQHMAQLKKAGVVSSYRHGYHVHYLLKDEALQAAQNLLAQWQAAAACVADCHENNPCAFRLDDGSNGCLYGKAQPKTR